MTATANAFADRKYKILEILRTRYDKKGSQTMEQRIINEVPVTRVRLHAWKELKITDKTEIRPSALDTMAKIFGLPGDGELLRNDKKKAA